MRCMKRLQSERGGMLHFFTLPVHVPLSLVLLSARPPPTVIESFKLKGTDISTNHRMKKEEISPTHKQPTTFMISPILRFNHGSRSWSSSKPLHGARSTGLGRSHCITGLLNGTPPILILPQSPCPNHCQQRETQQLLIQGSAPVTPLFFPCFHPDRVMDHF